MNKGLVASAVAGLTLALSLACGGGGGYDNVAACTKWIDHMNSLECYPAQMDASQGCPAALDMNTCDMSEYYDCMIEVAYCDEEGKFQNDPTQCNAGC